MERSTVFLDSFLDGFTLGGFLRPLRRPSAATQMFADECALEAPMSEIVALRARQEALQAEMDAQVRANELLRREIEVLKMAK